MRLIDADEIKGKYPDRKSLNQVMDNAKGMSATNIIEYVRETMCTEYCKIPYKYSQNEWDDMLNNGCGPCMSCPLNLL